MGGSDFGLKYMGNQRSSAREGRVRATPIVAPSFFINDERDTTKNRRGRKKIKRRPRFDIEEEEEEFVDSSMMFERISQRRDPLARAIKKRKR